MSEKIRLGRMGATITANSVILICDRNHLYREWSVRVTKALSNE